MCRRNRKAFPLALVLSPTRELSTQIHAESRKFAYQTGLRSVVVYGGAQISTQVLHQCWLCYARVKSGLRKSGSVNETDHGAVPRTFAEASAAVV